MFAELKKKIELINCLVNEQTYWKSACILATLEWFMKMYSNAYKIFGIGHTINSTYQHKNGNTFGGWSQQNLHSVIIFDIIS